MIPIDFVAGSHGNFLEIVLNKFFGVVEHAADPFNHLGSSHIKSQQYLESRLFVARHWFELEPEVLKHAEQIISIQFDMDELLLLSSISLLRAGDIGIDNDQLEVDTYQKLSNQHYYYVLQEILVAYPFLNAESGSIPRNVLREFFKFGFKDPSINGYWKRQQCMQYINPVFVFPFKAFYNQELLLSTLGSLEKFLNKPFNFCQDLLDLHEKFLSKIPYCDHKAVCDRIVIAVNSGIDCPIPALTLLQESYINAQLENIHNKEMPFHPIDYFTSTKDMLYYIKNQAPTL
jgi:hypothetical protein